VFAAQVGGWNARVGLFEDADDLFFFETSRPLKTAQDQMPNQYD
jgi:hypothetical protein